MRFIAVILLAGISPALVSGAFAGGLPGRTIADFSLPDTAGQEHRLSQYADSPVLVVVFLGAECPLARLCVQKLNDLAPNWREQGVQVLGVASNRRDAPDRLREFARQHALKFPLLRDAQGDAARRFGARRTPEVFVLDEFRAVRYQGRLDDQYSVGVRRPRATQHYLVDAVDSLLVGRPVTTPLTVTQGCLIDQPEEPSAANLREDAADRSESVAGILRRHCVECHRPGEIGPFSLQSRDAADAWRGPIAEAVEEGRMPPWGADAPGGLFANERRLTDHERQTLLAWARRESPSVGKSDSRDETAPNPPELVEVSAWALGKPDLVLELPEPFNVPAEGLVEYQGFELDTHQTQDRWVCWAEVRPGNRQVVHHCTVFVAPPGASYAAPEVQYFADFTPGRRPLALRSGMARLLPAGWRVYLSLHYVAVGSPQTDLTRLGLKFVDPATVRKAVRTGVVRDPDLRIPPGAADHRVEQSWRVPDDMLLLSMFPHMHLRGKSFRYELVYPDGRRETLLNIPQYDFNWQHQYALAEPKLMPAGSKLVCVARFDNSAANPHNPDPTVTVRTGDQSTDEMLHGYFDVALAGEDRLAPIVRLDRVRPRSGGLFAAGGLGLAWLILRRRGRCKSDRVTPN